MRFEKLEQFIEQKQNTGKVFDEMVKREQDAFEHYNSKKAEYEATIARAAIEGKDLTKELDRLDEEISKAKAAYERRHKERFIYSQSRPLEKLSSEDIVSSFNNEFIPAFRKEVYDNAEKALLRAKVEYVKAVQSYYAAVDEFEGYRQDVRYELGDHYQYQLKSIKPGTVSHTEKFFISGGDIYDLEGRKYPRSIQYVREEEIK
jgi:predicted nuclease with TOPRIM domain